MAFGAFYTVGEKVVVSGGRAVGFSRCLYGMEWWGGSPPAKYNLALIL